MANRRRNTLTGPSGHFRTAWTGGTPADYNVCANGPGGASVGYCSRWIVVSDPKGPLVVLDEFGVSVTIPLVALSASPLQEISISAIVADGSSAAVVQVFW